MPDPVSLWRSAASAWRGRRRGSDEPPLAVADEAPTPAPASTLSTSTAAQADEPQSLHREFVAAAKTRDVRPGQVKYVRLRGGHELVVVNVDGRFYAFDAYCPHNGWPLKWGAVDRGTLVCALHMWRFDLETGAAVDPPMADCLQTYPTRVVGDVVEVALHLR